MISVLFLLSRVQNSLFSAKKPPRGRASYAQIANTRRSIAADRGTFPVPNGPPTAPHRENRLDGDASEPFRTPQTEPKRFDAAARLRQVFAAADGTATGGCSGWSCGECSHRPCNGRSGIAANDPASQHDPASQRTDRQARPDGSRLRTSQQRRRALQQKTPGTATKATGFLAAEAASIAAGAAGLLAAGADGCGNGQQARHPDRQRGESPRRKPQRTQSAADAAAGRWVI